VLVSWYFILSAKRLSIFLGYLPCGVTYLGLILGTPDGDVEGDELGADDTDG